MSKQLTGIDLAMISTLPTPVIIRIVIDGHEFTTKADNISFLGEATGTLSVVISGTGCEATRYEN